MKKEPFYVKVPTTNAEASVWEVFESWEKKRGLYTLILFALQAMIIYNLYAYSNLP